MQFVVALAAEDAAGVQALRRIAGRRHRIAAAMTTRDSGVAGATVAGVAGGLGVPVRPAEEVSEPGFADWLRDNDVDLLLNVHSLHIVHPDALRAPPLGAFNLHPGPLPERAGLNSPSWALYEGAHSHGVSLHRMTAEVDEGDLAFSDDFPVGPADTGLTVLTQCVRRGLALVEQLLDVAERGEPIPAHAQDISRRRWFGAGPPQEGRLDWGVPASRVIDFVRACDYRPFPSPWGFPLCEADGRALSIVAAAPARGDAEGASAGTVLERVDGGVIVAAGEGLVKVGRIEVGGRSAEPADVLDPGAVLTVPRSTAPTPAGETR